MSEFFRFDAVEKMYSYVNQYFRLVQSIYKIGYGNDYSMPVVFAENLDDFPPLVQYINISQAPLNTCNNMELAKAIENFMFTYSQNFVDSSYRQVFYEIYNKFTFI